MPHFITTALILHPDAMYRGPRGLGRSQRPTSFLLTYRSEEAINIGTNCPNSHWIELGAHGHDGIVWLVGGPGPCSAPRALAHPNQSHCPLCCPAQLTIYIDLTPNLYINKLVFDYKRAAYRILHLLAPIFSYPSLSPSRPFFIFLYELRLTSERSSSCCCSYRERESPTFGFCLLSLSLSSVHMWRRNVGNVRIVSSFNFFFVWQKLIFYFPSLMLSVDGIGLFYPSCIKYLSFSRFFPKQKGNFFSL